MLTALAWFAGGVVGGATGLGSVMVAMPIMTMAISPGDAVLVSCIVSFYASIHQSFSYRRALRLNDVKPLAVGALPGCLLGVLVLKVAPVQMLELMVCAMLVCFVGMQLNRRMAGWSISAAPSFAMGAGAVFGFVSASVAMGGGPLAIYVMLRHWDPDRARANMSALWVFTSVLTCVVQAGSGMYSLPLFQTGLIGIAGTAAGQLVGVRLGRRIDLVLFRRILLMFLSAAAVMLFCRAMG
jgi:uncharacterized membrane protein YfcA